MKEFNRSPANLTDAIAANIRDLRKLKGLTQLDLATRVRLESTAIAKIETRKRHVSAEELWSIAGALEVDVSSLYDHPGLEEDRLLTALVLTPQRDLHAQLVHLRSFVSGDEEGNLLATVRRVADGVQAYRARVPDPLKLTASPAHVRQALADADRIEARHESFSRGVMQALNQFDADDGPELSISSRTSKRSEARRVRERGDFHA